MSVWMDYEITVELEGNWSQKAITCLNQALKWWNWGEYASFFSDLKFSLKKLRSKPVTESSNHISFCDILKIGVNGGSCEGWDEEFPLETRDSYDPAVDQKLKEFMNTDGLSITFEVKSRYEGDGEDDWNSSYYRVYSDGKGYLLRMYSYIDSMTMKLGGDWSSQDIELLNTALTWWNWYHYLSEEDICFPVGETELTYNGHIQDGNLVDGMYDTAVNGGEDGDMRIEMPLTERATFDPEVQGTLLSNMEAKGLTITCTFKDFWDNDVGCELSSDGVKFVVDEIS